MEKEKTYYVIENTCGQYWNGTCWGVEQVKKIYDTIDNLPGEIPAESQEENDIEPEAKVYII